MRRGTEAGTYTLYSTFNEAGLAKWWTVAAPGENIYGSKVNTETGEAYWGNSSGHLDGGASRDRRFSPPHAALTRWTRRRSAT